jgi:hypothetical protein
MLSRVVTLRSEVDHDRQVLAIDTVLLLRPVPLKPAPVRHPWAEVLVALLSFLVALAWLLSRFEGAYTIHSPILRLVAVSAVFNVALALVLLILRYRPGDLGIRFHGLAPVPLVTLCFGVLAAAFSPSSITLKAAYQEAGSIWGLLWMGFGEAALPEEFFRFVWQTRAGACRKVSFPRCCSTAPTFGACRICDSEGPATSKALV